MLKQIALKLNIIFFIFVFTTKCNKDSCDVVPETRVEFETSLSTPPFDALLASGNAVEVPINFGPYSKGFNSNGIIVFRQLDNDFVAFDRTCTFEHEKPVAINLNKGNSLLATCPECKSDFILSSQGIPTDQSTARCPLLEYSCYYYESTNEIRVEN